MRNFFSISHKITLQLILTGSLATIILGTYAYQSSRRAMLDRTFQQLTSVRTEKQNRLETFFNDRISELNHMADSEETMILLADWDPVSSKTAPSDFLYNTYISSLYFIPQNSDSCLRFIHQGDEAFQSKEAIPVWMSDITGQEKRVQIIDYTAREDSTYAFHIIREIEKEDVSGIIVIDIPQQFINEIMYENNPHNGLGNSGEAYLVGSDSLMRSTSRFHQEAIMKTTVKTPGVISALEGNTGTDIFPDYRKIEVISSFAPLHFENLNWAILAEIDFSEAMIPIHDLRNKFLFLGVFVASLLFILAWVLSRWISRPIIELSNASKLLGEGENPQTVEVNSNDEISELAIQFNDMAEKIQEQKQFLKQARIQSLRSMIDGQEKERQRLSREIHDSLGQMLIALKLKYQSEVDDTANAELLSLIDQTIEETRRLSNDLKPAELDEFGLKSALERLGKTCETIGKLRLHLDTDAIPKQMSRKYQTYLYRMVQEGINNIIKHSEADKAEIVFQTIEKELIVQIKDNGKGIQNNESDCGTHHGLKNLEDRANILGGEVEIKSEEGEGTRLIIRIPLNIANNEQN